MAEWLSSAWSGVASTVSHILTPSKVEQIIIREIEMNPSSGRLFVRIAGLSGSAAVCLGAYGSHVFLKNKDIDQRLKDTFEIANKYHFLIHWHSLLHP